MLILIHIALYVKENGIDDIKTVHKRLGFLRINLEITFCCRKHIEIRLSITYC